MRNIILGLSLLFSPALSWAADEESLSEFEKALQLTPDVEHGKKLFRACVTCHGPEAWGSFGSGYPQLAGQLPGVLIKQLADFRAGNRDNPIMRAFASRRSLGEAQDIADVAAYISQLPMSAKNQRGFPFDLAKGKQIYQQECEECHGKEGIGDPTEIIPKLQGQHYSYLMRQFDWIRNGRRRNADKKMIKQIKNFRANEQASVMSYLANIIPENAAQPQWRNSDFSRHDRSWRPLPVR